MLHRMIPREQIGGARVMKIIDRGGGNKILPVTNGAQTVLSREWLLGLQPSNLQSLVNTGKIDLYPLPPEGARDGQKFVAHRGGGAYDVIEGVKLNDKPLTGEEARAMVA